jgi:uncharacterized protein
MGQARLSVRVTSSAPIAYLSAKLCDVFPDGSSALVSRGILNLTHRESHTDPTPLSPGQPITVVVELDATSWIWDPGHRVRLDLAGSDFPSSWPPPATGSLTVDRAASRLVLPVLRGPSPDPSIPAFPPGDRSPHRPERVEWQTTEDILARERRVRIDHGGVRGSGAHRLEYHDRYGGEIVVRWAEPGIARATGGVVYELGWPDVKIRTEARGTLASDAETWQLDLELDVFENDVKIASRRWGQRVPRDLA